jgi:hypothetical protein
MNDKISHRKQHSCCYFIILLWVQSHKGQYLIILWYLKGSKSVLQKTVGIESACMYASPEDDAPWIYHTVAKGLLTKLLVGRNRISIHPPEDDALGIFHAVSSCCSIHYCVWLVDMIVLLCFCSTTLSEQCFIILLCSFLHHQGGGHTILLYVLGIII